MRNKHTNMLTTETKNGVFFQLWIKNDMTTEDAVVVDWWIDFFNKYRIF